MAEGLLGFDGSSSSELAHFREGPCCGTAKPCWRLRGPRGEGAPGAHPEGADKNFPKHPGPLRPRWHRQHPACQLAGARNLRVIDKDGQPWFVAADVCAALDLRPNPGNGSLQDHMRRLDADEVATAMVSSHRKQYVVAESGLYALIMRSRKPEALQSRDQILCNGCALISIQATSTAPIAQAHPLSHQQVTLTAQLQEPVMIPPATSASMHAPLNRDPMRICRYCRWVEVRRRLGAREDALSCTSKWGVRGRAGEGLSCCDFEREPGADDEA